TPHQNLHMTSRTRPRTHFLGLRTAKYAVSDLAHAKAWYSSVLGIDPYFDEPFYVGFNVGGFELGLDPNASGGTGAGGSIAYWGVSNADSAYARLISLGATEHETVKDVGGDIRIGSVLDPFGNVLGIIDNPGFRIEP
ncbi:MAG: VOC family protein, partial [Gemmatimonadaceae bacterium]